MRILLITTAAFAALGFSQISTAQTSQSQAPSINLGCLDDNVVGSCRSLAKEKKEQTDLYCRYEFARRGLKAPASNPCFEIKELLCRDELLSTGLYSIYEINLEESCSQLAVFKVEKARKGFGEYWSRRKQDSDLARKKLEGRR